MSEYLREICDEDVKHIDHSCDKAGQPQRNNFFAVVNGYDQFVLSKPMNFFQILHVRQATRLPVL